MMNWHGVIPAITTPFREDLSIDHDFLARHANWMVDAGSIGIVGLGSLGEGSVLSHDEKVAVLRTLVAAVGNRATVVAGIGTLATADAVRLAKDAQAVGCQGLMVLPPYVYLGDSREMESHFDAIFAATGLSCMLYNNPIAYRLDLTPDQVVSFANRHKNLHAVKESSADIRRVTEIRRLLKDRLVLSVGVDDLIVEGVAAGATGWIAGLVNAFPAESVALYQAAMAGEHDKARRIYEWFLPLLRLDVVPKFVQLIKLTQQEVGMGSERVRPPRLTITGPERDAALATIRDGIANRPNLATG